MLGLQRGVTAARVDRFDLDSVPFPLYEHASAKSLSNKNISGISALA